MMSEDKKLCPLQFNTPPLRAITDKDAFFCLEEKCAWWFGAMGCCSMAAIANSLFSIEEHVRWRKH